jgi:hypothetical protein
MSDKYGVDKYGTVSDWIKMTVLHGTHGTFLAE